MADESVLSSEIKSKEHLRIFDDLASIRFAALELEKILIYILDTVDEKALPILADQFDLLGNKGWTLAKTTQEQRDLIKRAIELHRYKGTPYAIKRAVQSVGYYGITLIEGGSGAQYNGEFKYNGFITYGGGNWATFRAILDIGESKGINDIETPQALALIEEYKNVRSKLISLGYKATLNDTVISNDDELSIDIGMVIIEGVDTPTETLDVTVEQSPIVDAFSSVADGDITLKVLNSLGEQINQYIF